MTDPSTSLGGLARALREHVTAADLSVTDLGKALGVSKSTASRYLAGRVMPDVDTSRRILDAAGVEDAERRAEILDAVEGLQDGTASRLVLLRGGTAVLQRRWSAVENASDHVQTFAQGIVPGLLQTAEYARWVFRSGGISDDEIEASVRARAERQAIVGDGKHRCTFVITEGALRWHIGDPAVMVAQLDEIAQLANRDDEQVRVGIIPWWQPSGLFPATTFNLYDAQAVIIGTGPAGTTVINTPLDVEPYVELFGQLAQVATFGPDAGREAERIRDDYLVL